MNESVKLVVEKLEELAKALKIGVEEIFPYYVLQVQIKAWIIVIIITIITPIMAYFAIRSVKEDWGEAAQIPLTTFAGIFVLITIFIYVIYIPDLFVPQVQAITDIIRAMMGYR